MLKLIRRDKTTVWCESRLSVRTAKREGGAAPIPLEMILTLRTVSEVTKTTMAHEFVGAHVPAAVESPPSERAVDADDYVEADDDGYQCEVDEEYSNNNGSGNDSGTTRTDTWPSAPMEASVATGVWAEVEAVRTKSGPWSNPTRSPCPTRWRGVKSGHCQRSGNVSAAKRPCIWLILINHHNRRAID